MSGYRNYYDSTFGRTPSTSSSRSTPSRIATKYGSAARNDPAPRIRTYLDAPSASYKSSRSREVSPNLDKSEKSTTSSSSGYLNPNRLYPRQYPRSSTSRESTISPASSTSNLPIAKNLNRPSTKVTNSKDNQYLNSRFLPKNSVQRSYTAYSRPSAARTHEVSRKSKEILNSLQVQEKITASKSCEDVKVTKTPLPEKEASPQIEIELETVKVCTRGTSPTLGSSTHPSFLRSRRIELAKTVEKTLTRPKTIKSNMVDKQMQSDRLDDSTRSSRFMGASRITATPWTNFLDMKFSSPKKNKLKQQDSAESPKSLSRTSSTKSLTASDKDSKKPTKSKLTPPKQVGDKKQLPPPIPKSEAIKTTQNKDFRKSVLNMNPDGKKKLGRRSNSASSAESDPDATDISENLTSCKSYRSSSKLKTTASNSEATSSSEDDSGRSKKQALPDDLASSKLPQTEAKSFLMRALAPVTNLFKAKDPENNPETESSKVTWILDPSSENTSTEEPRSAKLVFRRLDPEQPAWWEENSSCSEKTLQINSEPKDMKYAAEIEKSPDWWLDSGTYSGYNAENNMIKKPTDSGDKKAWWLEENSHGSEEAQDDSKKPGKYRIKANESGEMAWWLKKDSTPPEGVNVWPGNDEVDHASPDKPKIRHVQSGEKPWWLEDNPQEIPEEVCQKDEPKYRIKPNESGEMAWWLKKDSTPPEGVNVWPGNEEAALEKPKIRPVDSGEMAWWLKKDSTPPEGVKTWTPENEADWWQEKDKTHKLRHIDSGERDWWLNDEELGTTTAAAPNNSEAEPKTTKYTIRHQESGERAWWLQEPLGDRASPEGLEMPKDDEKGRLSPYDNVPSMPENKTKTPFISKHTNIDEILGGTGQLWSPVLNKIFGYDGDECREVDPKEVIIHEGRLSNEVSSPHNKKLDDAALQLYKDGDYGAYLDLEASISEQQEEFEGFLSNKKNSIVLRTQLSVRVHTIIEKLLTSEGRELRRALFSLKQIFQEDKDLVHEFVQNDGLSCLIKVGSEADQNYQNYILRALGQVMLYVDGMNGVMEHNQTIQWLYSLISSKFRLVVKTALKLLLVFVEYTDSNCMLLIKAIHTVDYSQGVFPYHNIMKLLKDFDSADTELLIYATTLINKILNGVPDQDTYYDQVDALEEQGIESIVQRYMSKPGTDLDLLQQFQIYEAVLQYEDEEEKGGSGAPIRHLDENLRKTLQSLRSRKSIVENTERRKSRRHSTGTTPVYGGFVQKNHILQEDYDESSSSSDVNNSQLNGSYKDSNKANEAGVTPALKRRRERAERQRSFMREQQETAALLKECAQPCNNNEAIENINGNFTNNGLQQRLINGSKSANRTQSYFNRIELEDNNIKQPWIMSMIQNQEGLEESDIANENERNILMQLKKENTVKDITQKLANQSIIQSPTEEKSNRFGDMCGLISKAKEGLAKSKSKADVATRNNQTNDVAASRIEPKKSENELRWEELVGALDRPLNLCDMDFTDLITDDEMDVLAPATPLNGIPPPPPPFLQPAGNVAPPPPPLSSRIPTAPPPVPGVPLFGPSAMKNSNTSRISSETKIPVKKNKKTVKLFWKEVRDDPISQTKLKSGYIWDELSPVSVDTQKLEHLFESRAKDLISKKQQELNKNKEIIVLDPKRSNAINIGMTKLPPPRSIKTAILKMDATIMNREGIEKLLTMLPTEEERTKIQDAQAASPDLPLGSAEQFLLTLASISELPARLKLWAFKLDFENSEREIAEPLMDLKQGFEVLKINKTFRAILSTLLSIGNFLNGNEVKGFQIEYLTKVPEVKDTVHKHSLLHHLCHIVMEKFPEASDLYSEIGAITRASKVDFDELSLNIQRLESDCKSSWDHLKLIAKHDGSTMMKVKMSDFLADCAERIILLGIIHRRIMNRFHKFLLWLGIPFHQIADTKPNEFCRIVSEFALEYRTTRERVLQQLEKKANHRERNKTRGKMITDIGKFRSKEDRADAELRQLLGSDMSDVESMQGTLPWRHRRRESTISQNNTLGRKSSGVNGHFTDGDDEILESLVKTATKGPRTAPRERKRTRHADRKSLRRTLKNGLSEEEKKHLSAYIKGY